MKKYKKKELRKWWVYRCEECGDVGLSKDLYVNHSLLDYCPKCFANMNYIKHYEEKESLKNRMKWFFRFITFTGLDAGKDIIDNWYLEQEHNT